MVLDLWRELGAGLRTFRKAPGVALLVILILALGIGMSTTCFSIVDAVLLKPLPYRDAGRLFKIWERAPRIGFPSYYVAPPDFQDWKDQTGSFEGIGAYVGDAFNLTGEGTPERLDGAAVTPGLLRTLGVSPIIGRPLTDADSPAGPGTAVLISYELWQRTFGGADSVLNRSIRLNGQVCTVVGVMPAGFQFPVDGTQIWVPNSFRGEDYASRDVHFLQVIGRLKPEVSATLAETDVQRVTRGMIELHPEMKSQVESAFLVPLQDEMVRDVRTSFWFLLAAALLVLMIACANVANLLLMRGVNRQREMAVRSALGASRVRVAVQLVVEGLFLSLPGGAIGVLLSTEMFRVVAALIPASLAGAVAPALDNRLLLFAVAISILTGLLFGLAPLRQALRANLDDSLRGRSDLAAHYRSRALVVALEAALAVVVVAGTGLMVRTIRNIEAVDPGFHADHVLTMRLELTEPKYSKPEQRIAFYRSVLGKVQVLPDTISAGFTTFLPLTNISGTNGVFIEGAANRRQPPIAYRREITPDYLRAMKVPLIRGRGFTEQDDLNHPLVVLIDDRLARRFTGDPIGQRVKLGPESSPSFTVAGIVGSVSEDGLAALSPRPTIYTSYAQSQMAWFFNPRDLAVRVRGNPLDAVASIRQAIWSVDKDQTIAQVRPLANIVEGQLSSRNLQAAILGSFSAAGLILAAFGVYALLSFVVASRTQEFGVRIALGARPQDLVKSVFQQALLWVGTGAIAGVALAAIIAQYVSSMVYGIRPADPLSLGLSVIVIIAAALTAACIPAWRATRIDPLVALRKLS
jgi:putative ABC transport system permease protein